MKALLLCKKTNFSKFAENILRSAFHKNDIFIENGNVGDPLREELFQFKPDYILSFLSPWIVPDDLLKTANLSAINFHPGPPRYPGTGCYNFALYEGAKEYGVTCHIMNREVDTGQILDVSRFQILESETVESLKLKSMIHLTHQFQKIVDCIARETPLPESSEIWERQPYKRKELETLRVLDPTTQSLEEIQKRIRATVYPGRPGPVIRLGEHEFEICENYNREPIA